MRPLTLLCGFGLCHALFSLGAPAPALSQTQSRSANALTVLAWNIEGAGSDPATIQKQLKELEPFDILALSEVPKAAAVEFASRWGAESHAIGSTGGETPLIIAWDPAKFDKIALEELKQVNGEEFAPGLQAAALVAHLRHKPSGQEFKIAMNHLARGSAELRKTQAQLLGQWARNQKLPIVAVGGYNFDYDFVKRQGNEAFDAFLEGSVWKWIKPKEFVDTNWADRNRDGKDDYPDSMLDFVFVAGPARQWKISSEVIVRQGDFPDDEKTSDQRPTRTVAHGW